MNKNFNRKQIKNLFILAEIRLKKRIAYQNIFIKAFFKYIIILINILNNNIIASKKVINNFFGFISYFIEIKKIKYII